MSILIDSYNTSNYATDVVLGYLSHGKGQAFTCSGYFTLNYCQFYIKKNNSPTGNATAKIYAQTGTYGTSSIPTGSPLATSDVFDVSTLTTSSQLISFTFSGSNKIQLNNSTYYVVTLEYTNGSSMNNVRLGVDNSTPSHSGNYSSLDTVGTWTADNALDCIFYVYGDYVSNFFQFM